MLRSSEIKPLFVDLSHSDKSFFYEVFLLGRVSIYFVFLMLFPEAITTIFTDDEAVLQETPSAMRWVFAATPIIAIQLIGAAYFQAVGKATPALLLTLTRQGIFFIPLIWILPKFYGELGVWMAFPISDVLSTIVTALFLHREVKLNLLTEEE